MSGDKKDLTRIEDLGEFLHQLEEGDEGFESELPEIPQVESSFEQNSFSSNEETSAFDAPPEEIQATEETSHFGTADFGGDSELSFEEQTSFESSEDPFASSSNEEINEADSFIDAAAEETPAEEASIFDEPATDFFEDATIAPAPEPEPEPERMVQRPVTHGQETYKTPENFSDVKKFSESSSFTGMGAEGNPSFSVLVKNVRYVEDVADIIILMKELGLCSDSEEQIRSRLMRGTLLVPRISEFAAVLFAHKLRRFDIDILVGLSDEIHPPKHGEAPETGIVSKHNLYQNHAHHFHFDDPKLKISQIIIAATPTLEGHQIVRYLGVASEHKMLDGHLVEDETSTDVPKYYQELAHKLKAHALKAHSNAVVGLNYQLTPLPSEYGTTGAKYRLTCTGNLVWVNKL